MRGMRTYVLIELAELLLIIIVIIVLAGFIHIPLWLAIVIPAGKLLKSVLVYPFVRKSFGQPILSGIESLIGRRGQTVENLNPEGYVKIQGELWKAVSQSGPIPADVEVEVCALDNTKLVVKAVGQL